MMGSRSHSGTSFGEAEVSLALSTTASRLPPRTPSSTDGSSSEITLHSALRRTPASPAGDLTAIHRPIRPHAFKILPPTPSLPAAPGVGNTWPEQLVIYDYLLAYKFSLKEAAEVSARFPSLNCQLYDSPYESQLYGLFDGHKRLLTYGDYYESRVKLGAGEYEVRLQVRHSSVEHLKRLRHLPMLPASSSPRRSSFLHGRGPTRWACLSSLSHPRRDTRGRSARRVLRHHPQAAGDRGGRRHPRRHLHDRQAAAGGARHVV